MFCDCESLNAKDSRYSWFQGLIKFNVVAKQLNFDLPGLPTGYDHNISASDFEPSVPPGIAQQLRTIYDNDCCTRAYSLKCEGCDEVSHQVIYGDGLRHKAVCPVCSNNKAKSRARDAYHQIYGFDWQNLGTLELTTPSDFVDPSRLDDADHLLERQEYLFELVKEFMDYYYPSTPYLATFHHWHSKEPLEGPHFHMHLVFPRATYHHKVNPLVSDGSNFLTWITWLPAQIPKEALIEMRRHWASMLGLRDADIYYQFIKRLEPQRVMHRLRYMFRGYIEDVNKWLLGQLEKGATAPANSYIQECCDWHLRDWHHRTRRYRMWSPSQLAKWVDRQEIGERIERDEQESKRRYCRVCLTELPPVAKVCVGEVVFESVMALLRKQWKPEKPPPPCMWGMYQQPIEIDYTMPECMGRKNGIWMVLEAE